MVILLDAASLISFVNQPGVAFIYWRAPGQPPLALFESAFQHAADENRHVRYGVIDAAGTPRLRSAHEIEEGPALTAYRDGILVFSHTGPLPGAVMPGLLDALSTLDMQEVRRGLDGGGTRLVLVFHPEDESPFSVEPSDEGEGGPPKLH